MNDLELATKFSIYKIDTVNVEKAFFKESNVEAKKIVKCLIENIKTILNEKKSSKEHYLIEHSNYMGIIFKTYHNPVWKQLLESMIDNTGHEKKGNDNTINESYNNKFIRNENVSYVIFRIINKNIYAMTGGYGSHYIRNYIEKNYGLHLLPKFLDKDSAVVKNLVEKRLFGNILYSIRTNRANTTFNIEKNLSSIYSQLNVEIDKNIAETLGIGLDDKRNNINLINKDSIVIQHELTLDELTNVLKNLNKIESKDDKFALNYLELSKKINIKNSDLFDVFTREFDKFYQNFILDYDNTNTNKHYITTHNDNIFIEKDSQITIKEIIEEVKKQNNRITLKLKKEILKKWQVKVQYENEDKILSETIYNTLFGYIEYHAKNFYLINGDWYFFDNKYLNILDNEFNDLFNLKSSLSKKIIDNYNLKIASKNEEEYNKLLQNNKKVIVTHKILLKNIEIADAIFWDKENLYLMCNKNKFNGTGVRDLINQILSSANYIQNEIMASGYNFLSEYYKQIRIKNNVQCELLKIEEKQFIDNFLKKRICFIAGFVEGYRSDSKSFYAKYSIIEANKILSSKGYDFIPTAIN